MLDGLVKGFRSLFGGDDEEKRRQQQQNQTTQPKNTNQNLFGSNVSSQFNASGFNANSNSTADAQARADAERRRKEAEDERKRQEEAAKRKREAEETARKAEAAKKQAEALRKQRQQNVLGQNFVNGANQATTIKPVVNQELTRKAINEEATTKNLDTQAQKYGGINDQTSGREIDIRKRSNSLYEQNMKREESQASWLDKQFGREQMKKRAYDLARSQAIRDQARDLNYEDRDTTNILSQSVAMQRRRAQEEAKQAQEDLKLQNIPGNVAYHAANTGLGLVKGGTRAVTNFVPTTAEALTSGAANTVKFFDEDNEFANKVLENIKKDRENNQVRKYVDKYTKANNQDNQIANQIGEGLAGVAIDSALTLGTGGLVAPARHGINAHQGMMEDLDNIEQRKKAEAEAKGETYIPESFKQKYLAATGHALTQAAIEKMGIDALLNPLGGSLAGRALSGFLSEGAEEGAQQFAENAVKRGFDDKQNLMEGVGESALVGGITGGIGAGIYGGSEQEDNQVRINRLSPDQMKYNAAEVMGAITGDTKKRLSDAAFRDLQRIRQDAPFITQEGSEIGLSRQGNKKYSSTGSSSNEFVLKQRIAPKMGEIIQKSSYMDRSPDLKNHRIAPDGFDYRSTPIRYRGSDYTANLDIAKDNTQGANVLYEGDIRKNSPRLPGARSLPGGGELYTNSIPQTTPEVNNLRESYAKYGQDFYDNLTPAQQVQYETLLDNAPKDAEGRYQDPITGETWIDSESNIILEPDAQNKRLANILDYYKQNPSGFDVNALKAEFANNPTALAQIDNAITQQKEARKATAERRRQSEEIGREINQAKTVGEYREASAKLQSLINNESDNLISLAKNFYTENENGTSTATWMGVTDMFNDEQIQQLAQVNDLDVQRVVREYGQAKNSQSFAEGSQPKPKTGIVKGIKASPDTQTDQKANHVPLKDNHYLTRGNLYTQTKLGTQDVTSKVQKDGLYEYRQHTKRRKDGKTFTQFERRYVGDGTNGDWMPYSRALYMYKSQTGSIDAVNKTEVIQKALEQAYKDGEVRDFIAYTNPESGKQVVEKIKSDYTLDGGFVLDPNSGTVMGNHIRVTPFGVVNQIGGKFDLIGYDEMTSENGSGMMDTFMRASEKNLTTPEAKKRSQDLYYEKTMGYAEYTDARKQAYADQRNAVAQLEKDKPRGVNKKQFWTDVMGYLEEKLPLSSKDQTMQQAFAERYGENAADSAEKYKQWFRAVMDQTLEDQNKVRRTYGMPEIEHRSNYVPHINERGGFDNITGLISSAVQNGVKGDMNISGRGNVPESIAGLTSDFKPNKKWNPHEMVRRGNETTITDPRVLFEKYMDTMLYNQYMIPTIVKGRNMEAALRSSSNVISNEPKLIDPDAPLNRGSKQVIAIQDFVNDMAGKSSPLDREIGDRAKQRNMLGNVSNNMQVLRKLESINGANKILGNISSTFSQALNLPETVRDNGIRNTVQSFIQIGSKDARAAMEKSPFLRERYTDVGAKYSKTNWRKTTDAVSKWTGMDFVERAFIEINWRANWNRFRKEGLTGFELMKETDRATERAVGGRGVGAMPPAYRSAIGNMFLQFTYETNESWRNNIEHGKGIVKGIKSGDNKAAFKGTMHAAEAFVTAAALNALYELFTGRKPLPDVVGLFGDNGDDDDEDKNKIVSKGIQIASEISKANPFASAVINTIPKDERKKIFGTNDDFGRFDGATGVVQTGANLLGAGYNAINGDADGLKKNVLGLVPGGSQVNKTSKAVGELAEGDYGWFDTAKGLVFGKNAMNGGGNNSAKTGVVKGVKASLNKDDEALLERFKESQGVDYDKSVQYNSLKNALERQARLKGSDEYKDSLAKINDDTTIKIAKGELIQNKDDGLLYKKDGGVAKDIYKNVAKKLNEGISEDETRTSNVYRDYIYSDEGKAHEYNEMKKEMEDKIASGEMTFAAQIKAQKDLNRAEVMSTFNKYYRDGFSVVNNYNDTGKMYAMLESDEKRGEMQLQLNQINQKLLESGIITEKTYKSNYKSINQTGSSSGSGKGKGGSRGRGTFSAPNLPTSDYSSGAPKVSSGANKGKGIVKGIKVNSASADRGGVTVQDLPRARVKVSR
ncbi:MAG: hypothetical protein EOM35_03870 [Negativicutes bacterium]|nr:hypothetical protein [Negativicutes bacterium]